MITIMRLIRAVHGGLKGRPGRACAWCCHYRRVGRHDFCLRGGTTVPLGLCGAYAPPVDLRAAAGHTTARVIDLHPSDAA